MSTEKRFNLLSPYLSQIDMASTPIHDSINTSLNKLTIKVAYKAFICITADLLTSCQYSDPSQIERIGRLTSYLCDEDPSVVLKNVKNCYDLLIDFVSMKNLSISYGDFKDLLIHSSAYNGDSSALFAPISRLLSLVLSGRSQFSVTWHCPNKLATRIVLQYFGFLSKLPLENTLLKSAALTDYLALEENYPVLDNSNKYLKPLILIITNWMRDFRYDGSLCRHGTGAVADAKAYQYDKYRNMRVDTRLEYLYRRESFLGLWDYLPLTPCKEPLNRCSKLTFVPKNVSKLRSISMEPASLQFVQQGVMLSLYDYFKKHDYLKNHIKLEDQMLNKSLAYDGSITNRYATIDLSSASDLVSYSLVKRLFAHSPEFLRWAIGTRSDRTLLPNGKELNLKKFAPMGSALCFPTETLIFAACAELAVRLAHEQGLTRDNETGIYTDNYSVYGDDIIVPIGAYDICSDILISLGFRLNSEKSYCNSPFKESCGGNYLGGLDVTPIRWKTSFSTEDVAKDASVYNSICSYTNMCFEQNYRVTRTFCITLLKTYFSPLFTSETGKSPFITSIAATNFHLKHRWNRNYQRDEVRSTFASTVSCKEIIDVCDADRIHYDQWLRLKDRQCIAHRKVEYKLNSSNRVVKIRRKVSHVLSNNMRLLLNNATMLLDCNQVGSNLGIQDKITSTKMCWVVKPSATLDS